MPCARSSVGTASQPTALRDRERAPRSGRADGPSSALGSSGAACAVTTSACSSSCSGGTASDPVASTGDSAREPRPQFRRFQRRAGLAPDGVVGPHTARRLCSHPACAWRGRGSAHIRVAPSGSVDAAIDFWSRTYGVDAHLVRAVALWESGYNNSLVSATGARGVMQVTPATWDYVETILVGRQIPHTGRGNVHVGVAFLHQLLGEFRGDVRLALAAYVQGPRSVRRKGQLRVTRHYVAGVLALSRRL